MRILFGFLAVLILAAGPAEAAGPRLHDLTKRRQMEAIAPPSPLALTPYRGGGPVSSKWFWEAISPDASFATPRRWSQAVALVERKQRKEGAIFHAKSRVTRIINSYGKMLQAEAEKRGVPVALLVALIAVESGGNPRAISPKGAGGLMQLMPGTARRFGVRNSLAPAQNIRGGTAYLKWLLKRYGGDPILALAGYNAGEAAVDRFGGVPPYRETRDYVPKVAAAYSLARHYCRKGGCEIR